jgi:hypothetical protein
VAKRQSLAKTKRNTRYPDSIKEDIAELLNDGFLSVDTLAKNLKVSKSLVYDISRSRANNFNPKKKIKQVNTLKENKSLKDAEKVYNFLEISPPPLSPSSLQKTNKNENGEGSENETREFVTKVVSPRVSGLSKIDQTKAIAAITESPHLKPFMKVSSPSGYSIEIWG